MRGASVKGETEMKMTKSLLLVAAAALLSGSLGLLTYHYVWMTAQYFRLIMI